jgi:hypothetical protein
MCHGDHWGIKGGVRASLWHEFLSSLWKIMKRPIFLTVLGIVLGLLIFAASGRVWGEAQVADNATSNVPVQALHTGFALPTLKTIFESTEELIQQIGKKQEELQAVKTDDQKARILKELAELNGRLDALTQNFEQIATGVNLQAFTTKPKKSFDWREELQDVLGPIVKELQNVTARPREIENLRGEVAYYEKQIATAKSAVQHVQRLITETEDESLRKELQAVETDWKQREQQLSSNLAVVHYQLNERVKDQKPFLESFQNLMKDFFKSRGKNLLFALSAFVVVLFLFRFLYRFIYRFSPMHKSGDRNFYTRLTDLIFYGVTFLGATGASLLVLYATGDWVLLSLAALFLLGIVWGARQTLPKFWTEAKFLLNLGTVREDERIVYHGIPWKVESLNFSTQLVNPQLKGGMLRLPLRELMDIRSRPYDPAEPWFPCKESEWVKLADGTLGQVAIQTPEMVELTLLGGSRKTYPTAEFLKQNPNNISIGYRLCTTFRLDYQHQSESTREIPEKLQEAVLRGLKQEAFAKNILNVSVEFQEAQTSSLDLAILVDVGAKAGRHYDKLTRIIQRIAVEASNEYGWVIPFPQITLHTSGPPDESLDSPPQAKGKKRWSLWK